MDTLSIKKVSKQYGNFVAVDDVTFDVPQGVIYGLLGPNGAGKTSLIRIINSISMAVRGELRLYGDLLSTYHLYRIRDELEVRRLYLKMDVIVNIECGYN